MRGALLAWYDRARRTLPWRSDRPELYRVWLSEVMLQQTTTGAVAPYFAKFLKLFPSVEELAAAPRERVLEAWAGLGYYSRARNLHAAAQALAAGGFPRDEAGWRALPGVGPYTAAAITAIGLGLPANAVDGNIERVMARLYAVAAPLPAAKPELKRRAGELVTAERPGDWVQALMDLGATVCTPKAPRCLACPLTAFCVAYAEGDPARYPARVAKAARPERHGVAFRLHDGARLWLVRRPEQGLLAGMVALPTTPWRDEPWSRREALAHAPTKTKWRDLGAVRHVFTHFGLTLSVYAGDGEARGEGWWASASELKALPTVFKKAAMKEKPDDQL